MKHIFILSIIFIAFFPAYSFAQETGIYISGNVFIEDYAGSYPVHATVHLVQDKSQGTVADTAGYFEIKNIKPGKHKIRFSYMGCFNYDTTLMIKDKPVDSLSIKMSYWYDKEETSPASARENIRKGYPALYALVRRDNLENFYSDSFWKKYNISYMLYEEELILERRQYFGAPFDVLIKYNEEVFRYLDSQYNKQWRVEAPLEIVGLKEWMKKYP